MAEIIPDLELDICGLILLNLLSPSVVQCRFWRHVFGRVGALVRHIDLFIPQDLAAAHHNQKRREPTQRRLHNRTDEWVRKEFIVGVHLDLLLDLDCLAVNNHRQMGRLEFCDIAGRGYTLGCIGR